MSEGAPKKRKLWRVAVIAPLLVWAAIVGWAKLTPVPAGLGVADGHLAACPAKPNCVSTQAAGPDHGIEALPLQGGAEASIAKLSRIVTEMAGSSVVASDGRYLRAEFTSRLFRFVDDVEFYAPSDGERIELRSASRTGYSDLGANRKRMEQIRQRFVEQP